MSHTSCGKLKQFFLFPVPDPFDYKYEVVFSNYSPKKDLFDQLFVYVPTNYK